MHTAPPPTLSALPLHQRAAQASSELRIDAADIFDHQAVWSEHARLRLLRDLARVERLRRVRALLERRLRDGGGATRTENFPSPSIVNTSGKVY